AVSKTTERSMRTSNDKIIADLHPRTKVEPRPRFRSPARQDLPSRSRPAIERAGRGATPIIVRGRLADFATNTVSTGNDCRPCDRSWRLLDDRGRAERGAGA